MFPAGGLVDPTLGYPARCPTSWRRRSITAGSCENQVAEGRYSVGRGQGSIFRQMWCLRNKDNGVKNWGVIR